MLPVAIVSTVLFGWGGYKDSFRDRFSGGGMSHSEQRLLAKTYMDANSVFEWGMGSSTLIAAHVQVPRLTAIDSALPWVLKVRTFVANPAYTLRHANIGPVIAYGNPKDDTYKSQWPDYSLQVARERAPYDVYLVDGRFRIACVCQAMLHGRADSLILVHDFGRREYQVLLTLAEKLHQVKTLAVLQRKRTTTDAAIDSIWQQFKFVKA